MNGTHHHLRKQQTEREQRETWVRGCPHDLLCSHKSPKAVLIAASPQASHRSLWGVCLCGLLVSVCVLLGKGWILGPYTRPLICKWVDPWPLPHTQLFTPPHQDPPLILYYPHTHTLTALNVCIPANCSHKDQSSSRQRDLRGNHWP